MKINTIINKAQSEILSILFQSGQISFESFLVIIDYNLFGIFNDYDNALARLSNIISKLSTDGRDAYSKGYNDGYNSGKFQKKDNPFDNFNLHNLQKLSPHITTEVSTLNYFKSLEPENDENKFRYFNNPIKVNPASSKGRLSKLEKEVIHLEFLGLLKLSLDNKSTSNEFFDLDEKFKSNICLTEEGEIIAKRILDNRRVVVRPPKVDRNNVFVASAGVSRVRYPL
tara:strand:- start:136 stop:816 length:681 start_codon:yes stop_codon:yes gene_type:complete